MSDNEKSTGQIEDRLDESVVPPAFDHIWHAFMDLHKTRRSGFDIARFCFVDIRAYEDLHGLRFTPWEVDTICAMDAAVVKSIREEQAARAANKESK